MSNNIVNNYSSTIITIFKDVIEKYEENLEIIKQTESELNDVNHEIELSAPKDMYKGYLCYKDIRDLRIMRRVAKDENELLQDMYDLLTTQQGQAFKNNIKKVQSSSARIYDAQQRRTYKPRKRKDLTITNKTCDSIPPFEDLLAEFKKTKITMQNGKLRK